MGLAEMGDDAAVPAGMASELIHALDAAGKKFTIDVRVGAPCRVDAHEWVCPVSLAPLSDRPYDVHGNSSLQALGLGLSLVVDVLRKFERRGGRLMYADGARYDLGTLALVGPITTQCEE